MADTKQILDMLSADDAESIREGAYMAGEAACEEAIDLIAKHVQSSNIGVQEAADHALRKIGGKAAIAAVTPLLRSDDAPVRNIAMDVLREIGAQDLPALIQLLHDEDADIRIFASDILGSADNITVVGPLCDALLKDPEVNVRYQAAVSLGELACPEAADCLGKSLKDEEWVQFASIEALKKIRDEASVNALAGALDKSSDLVGSMIIEALGEMGNIKAVALLLRRLESSATALRNIIVKAIVQIMGGKSLNLLTEQQREKFREYLLIALEDTEKDIQDAAMQGLAYVGGEPATKAILGLAAGMDADRDADRLQHAVTCLASIGYNQSLAEAVKGDEEYIALIALEVLARIHDEAAAQMLMDIFWDKGRDIQREIVTALISVTDGGYTDFFLEVLERHDDGTVLKGALKYLSEHPGGPESGERVFGMLSHQFDDVKEAALEACVGMGGADMMERFRGMVADPEPLNRLMAVYALGNMGAEEAREDLEHALEDEVPDIRKVALEALASSCAEDEESMSLVVNRLSDENKDVRLAVVELLGRCPFDHVAPHIVQALADEDDWVKIRAVEALGERRVESAVPELMPLIENDNTLVALKAVEALGAIGGQTAFRALLEVANGENPELSGAAEEALARMHDGEGEI